MSFPEQIGAMFLLPCDRECEREDAVGSLVVVPGGVKLWMTTGKCQCSTVIDERATSAGVAMALQLLWAALA